jgi:hypothetical protein
MKLQDIAIARSGDKGDRATLSVIARQPADYPVLERLLTVAAVKAHYAGIVRSEVERYALPHLGAVHFVLHAALGGGVTRSLGLDAHGKTLSAAILDLALPPQATVPPPAPENAAAGLAPTQPTFQGDLQ